MRGVFKMSEIQHFIETFLGAPLQLVIILLCFALFLYWFIKERPKINSSQIDLAQNIMKEYKRQSEDNAKEREGFFKIMDDYRVQNERISALYDKALENSTRAIENNTEVIKNQNTHAQLTNQTLATLNDEVQRTNERLERIDENERKLYEKVQESVIFCKSNHST